MAIKKSAPSAQRQNGHSSTHANGNLASRSAPALKHTFATRPVDEPDAIARLSPRQLDAINLLFKGLSYKEISESLGISLFTVRSHLHSAYKRLQVKSRGQAVARILRETSANPGPMRDNLNLELSSSSQTIFSDTPVSLMPNLHHQPVRAELGKNDSGQTLSCGMALRDVRSVKPMKSPSGNSRRGGFTLIELLVVIAIIAILAAMLLPVLSAAQRRAQEVACVSNVKELATADILYVGDYGKFIEPSENAELGGNGEWMGSLIDYYSKGTNALICPVAQKPAPPGTPGTGNFAPGQSGTANNCYVRSLTSSTLGWVNICCSYQCNGWLYTKADGTGAGDGSDGSYNCSEGHHGVGDPLWYYGKESSMEKPANTPFFVDGLWCDTWPDEADSPSQNLYTGQYDAATHGNEMGRFTIQRHGGVNPGAASRNWPNAWQFGAPKGTLNIGLGDGHVEASRLISLWGYNWHRSWNLGIAKPGVPTQN